MGGVSCGGCVPACACARFSLPGSLKPRWRPWDHCPPRPPEEKTQSLSPPPPPPGPALPPPPGQDLPDLGSQALPSRLRRSSASGRAWLPRPPSATAPPSSVRPRSVGMPPCWTIAGRLCPPCREPRRASWA